MNKLPNLQIEFDRAAQARARGNEGQARVCARRAAGIAIREYFANNGTRVATASAYDLLNILKDDAHLPAELKTAVEHLTARVTEEFKLPVDADLIVDSRKLCDWLLKTKP
jgi:hypothetical protein